MKYVPLPAFQRVEAALHFDTNSLRVTGSCDLYTTKRSADDKSLMKKVDEEFLLRQNQFEQQRMSMSPTAAAGSPNAHPMVFGSPKTAFGSMSDATSRRTFAVIVATMNASHPDYDFSQVLSPDDFHRIHTLGEVIHTVDDTINNLRFNRVNMVSTDSSRSVDEGVWSAQHWRLVDDEMKLKQCEIYRYCPEVNPLDEDEPCIWRFHFLFYNRELKRVCYLSICARSWGMVDWDEYSEPMTPPIETPRKKRPSDAMDDYENVGKRSRFWFGADADNDEVAWSFNTSTHLEDFGKKKNEAKTADKTAASPDSPSFSEKLNNSLPKDLKRQETATSEESTDSTGMFRKDAAAPVRALDEHIYETLEL